MQPQVLLPSSYGAHLNRESNNKSFVMLTLTIDQKCNQLFKNGVFYAIVQDRVLVFTVAPLGLNLMLFFIFIVDVESGARQ